MKRASRKKPPEEHSLGDKLLRSAQQAQVWVAQTTARHRPRCQRVTSAR